MLSDRIGIFCDNTRDVIKGGCFDAREPGYVEGKPGSFWDIGGAVAAWCRSDKLPAHSPAQIVSYVSAHDNFTLWDKLLLVRYARPEYTAADSAALAQNRLAAGIYLTCMGMPFLQAGEEFARTKKGQSNSYRSSPALNRLDWKRAAQFHGLVDYYRGLLGLRARFPRLSAPDAASPASIRFFSLEQPLVGWTLPAAPGDGAEWRALCVFYNPTGRGKTGQPAGRPVEAAERRRFLCSLEKPQPGLRRRGDAPPVQRHHLRARITKKAARRITRRAAQQEERNFWGMS